MDSELALQGHQFFESAVLHQLELLSDEILVFECGTFISFEVIQYGPIVTSKVEEVSYIKRAVLLRD